VREEILRRLRATRGRGRKVRGVAVLLRPYRWRVVAMFAALLLATAATLLRRRWPSSRSTTGSRRATRPSCTGPSPPFIASALVLWGATWVQTYLVGWVGQRALQDLRIEVFGHLQRMSIGFYSRRRSGVLISRLTNDVEALNQLVSTAW
jgi:ATP-binding cassette subfamily B protein